MKNVKKHPIFRCPCKFQMTSTSSSLIKCHEKLRTHRHRAHPMMEPRETVEVRAEGWRERLALGEWCWLMAAAGWAWALIRMPRTVRLARMVLLLPV